MYQDVKFNKRILVAPLDWGLGHATRCIPIIRELIGLGCEVWIATAGSQKKLLETEFPQLPFLHLPGYGVYYGKRGAMFQLLRQIPVIRRHIFTENAWLQQAVLRYGFQGVISDNRYGLYSNKASSVLISHQLNLQLPCWAGIFRKGVNNLLLQHFTPFKSIWVPDLPNMQQSLAGKMSHPVQLPETELDYIGWLSRFEPKEDSRDGNRVLISLSGPEPQRSILEEKVLQQVPFIRQPFTLVRGLPESTLNPEVPEHVTIYNHLSAKKMQEAMQSCSLLISRSGYSTLMDAMVTQTPFACIPTPGQTEQEYLSRRIQEKGWGISRKQHQFDLQEIIQVSESLNKNHLPNPTNSLLVPVLKKWLKTV